MHRRTLSELSVVILLVATATVGSSQGAQAQASACRAADDISERTTSLLKSYVTSTDSFSVRLRNTLGLTGTASNKISYSTDSRTCSSAVSALNTRFATPGRARTVYVWKVGTNFAVEDPSDQLPEGYRSVLFFTSKWAFKNAWAPN